MKKNLDTAAFFDTSVLIPLLNEDHVHYQEALIFFKEYTRLNLAVTISSQNILEITAVLGGKYKIDSKIVAKLVYKLLADPLVQIIYPNPGVVNRFLKFLKAGTGLYYADLFLAATALEHGFETIVTNDRDFRKIKGIKVHNPFI